MKILITGGAGFQGSHLAERCVKLGHKVTVLNTWSEEALGNLQGCLTDVTMVWGSITDAEVVEKTVRGQDVVFHLAARINVDESISVPLSYLQVNVLGTCNVLEAVRKYGCRMVFASSCEVYGTTSEVAAPEAAPLNPHSPYAASKAGADRLCYAYVKTYGLNAIIVRPCNVYGPRQKDGPGGAVIPRFVSRALRGEPLVVFGSGQQQREYMHVDDLVDGYLLLLNRTVPPGETINLGTGETPSIKETAEFIASRLNAKVTHGEARPGEVQRFTLDSSKARQLGFRPRVTFREGLDQYIQWRRSLVGR